MKIKLWGALAALLLLGACTNDTAEEMHIFNLTGTGEVGAKDTIRLQAMATEDAVEWLVDGATPEHNTDPLFKFTSTVVGRHTVTLKSGGKETKTEVEVIPQFRHGMFILNEGASGQAPASLLFVSVQGVVEPHAIKTANGDKELLSIPSQDLFFTADGKLYIVAQNGARLQRFDAETLVRDDISFPALNVPLGRPGAMNSPSHVAVLDEQNVFIRDNNGIHLFNAVTKAAPVLINGTAGANKNRMAVVDGRVFAGCGNKVVSLEKGGVVAATLDMEAKVTGVIQSYDGALWVSAVGGAGNIVAKVHPATLQVIKKNEFAEGSVSNGSAASPGICALGENIFFSGGGKEVWHHNFSSGTTAKLFNAVDFEPDALQPYATIGIDPRTGAVVMTTMKGFGQNFRVNNVMSFRQGETGVFAMISNLRDLTAFPAGIWFR